MPYFNAPNKFSQNFNKKSPFETKLGRWLMGRKKHVADDGSITITNRNNEIVKQKANKKSSWIREDKGKTFNDDYRSTKAGNLIV